MNKLSIVAIALLLTQGAVAQNTAEIKKEINTVKRSNSHIYAETTASTIEEAKAVHFEPCIVDTFLDIKYQIKEISRV